MCSGGATGRVNPRELIVCRATSVRPSRGTGLRGVSLSDSDSEPEPELLAASLSASGSGCGWGFSAALGLRLGAGLGFGWGSVSVRRSGTRFTRRGLMTWPVLVRGHLARRPMSCARLSNSAVCALLGSASTTWTCLWQAGQAAPVPASGPVTVAAAAGLRQPGHTACQAQAGCVLLCRDLHSPGFVCDQSQGH